MDVLANNDWRRRRTVPTVDAELDLVVEDADSGFCGAVVGFEFGAVVLEDRHGKRRNFPLEPAAFLLDGEPVTLTRPAARGHQQQRKITSSGSIAVAGLTARVARRSRIWVEGIHDAELVERIWGDDLRVEGVVVEPLDGIDELSEAVTDVPARARRRLGVLVDHLVPQQGSRIVGKIRSPYVLITGHPYVDVWQAVKPAAVGIRQWPVVPPGRPWKEGVCEQLGVAEPADCGAASSRPSPPTATSKPR